MHTWAEGLGLFAGRALQLDHGADGILEAHAGIADVEEEMGVGVVSAAVGVDGAWAFAH